MTPLAGARVLLRGGGEMGSAAARLLSLSGASVVILERPGPLAVRRLVCFAQALLAGACEVEGVRARRLGRAEVRWPAPGEDLPVAVDPEGELLETLQPQVVVDARMAKRNLGSSRAQAPVVIGLGPGFRAGEDVHAVVETQRGPDLGRVLWRGSAEADTGLPAAVLGHTHTRVLRAPASGVFRAVAALGARVEEGELLATIGDTAVHAAVGGLLRGLVADGVEVAAGVKVGDIDPRGDVVAPAAVSDKARAVAAGVLEAAAVGLRRLGPPFP